MVPNPEATNARSSPLQQPALAGRPGLAKPLPDLKTGGLRPQTENCLKQQVLPLGLPLGREHGTPWTLRDQRLRATCWSPTVTENWCSSTKVGSSALSCQGGFRHTAPGKAASSHCACAPRAGTFRFRTGARSSARLPLSEVQVVSVTVLLVLNIRRNTDNC